jgi:hypothetical protein
VVRAPRRRDGRRAARPIVRARERAIQPRGDRRDRGGIDRVDAPRPRRGARELRAVPARRDRGPAPRPGRPPPELPPRVPREFVRGGSVRRAQSGWSFQRSSTAVSRSQPRIETVAVFSA